MKNLRRCMGFIVLIALFCGWISATLTHLGVPITVASFLATTGIAIVSFGAVGVLCAFLLWCFS